MGGEYKKYTNDITSETYLRRLFIALNNLNIPSKDAITLFFTTISGKTLTWSHVEPK